MFQPWALAPRDLLYFTAFRPRHDLVLLPALWAPMETFEQDSASLRTLQRVMDNGVGGVMPGGFPTTDTCGKKMSVAKKVLKEIVVAAGHPRHGNRVFSDDAITELLKHDENKMLVKMIAFVKKMEILNMTNDNASPHPERLAAFHGVREVAYRSMDVEMFDYATAFTYDRMVQMGTCLATLRNGL